MMKTEKIKPSVFKDLFIKETHLNLMNLRFQVAFIIIITMFVVGTFFNIKETIDKRDTYNKYYSQWLEDMKQQAGSNATSLAVLYKNFIQGPRNNSFISDCKERFMPDLIVYNAYNVYGFDVKSSSNNPLLNSFDEINWSFILITVISLLSLLLTFDSISGEREAHTLALCFSNPVSRVQVLLAKWTSVLTVLMATVMLGIIISLLILVLKGQLVLNNNIVGSVALFFSFALLFTSLMSIIGLLCSSFSSNSNVSLLYAISLWLIFSIVVPNTAVLWADKMYPVKYSNVVDEEITRKHKEIIDSYPNGKFFSDRSEPFHPYHKIRATMKMDLMRNDKMIIDAYIQDLRNQFEKSRAITNISPVSLFGYSMEAITGGGYLRFQHNWEGLHTYQDQFLKWFKAYDAKDPKSPHWHNPWDNDVTTTTKPVKFEEVPIYTETLLSGSERFTKIAFYAGLLMIYIFIFFYICFIKFVKSDVR